MGQDEIIEVLEKLNKPLSCHEIAEFLNAHQTKVNHLLKTLIKFGEVAFFELDGITAKKLYGEKAVQRRMRIYFLPKDEKENKK